jgi:hypothetical protein
MLPFLSRGDCRSKMIRTLAIVICVALLSTAALPSAVYAASKTVNPGQSIQDAINSMSPGDMLQIAPGTYTGSLYLNKNNLTLIQAPNTFGEVIINGNKNDYTLRLNNAPDSVLSGLTITNARFSDIFASNSANCQVLNCRITNWALIGTASIDPNRAGICLDYCSDWTVKSTYMDNAGHGSGPQIDSQYDDIHCIYGILIMHSNGGHHILNNEFYGAYFTDNKWIYEVNDFLSNDDWNQPNNSWCNSTISGNTFRGSFDDVIQLDGCLDNITVGNNFIDGVGARALISTNPCYNGPIYIRNNILVHWRSDNVALKWWLLPVQPMAPNT